MQISKSEVMRDAHRRWAYARSRGWDRSYARDRWTWGRCLALAWAAAKQRQAGVKAYRAAPIVRRLPAQSCRVNSIAA